MTTLCLSSFLSLHEHWDTLTFAPSHHSLGHRPLSAYTWRKEKKKTAFQGWAHRPLIKTKGAKNCPRLYVLWLQLSAWSQGPQIVFDWMEILSLWCPHHGQGQSDPWNPFFFSVSLSASNTAQHRSMLNKRPCPSQFFNEPLSQQLVPRIQRKSKTISRWHLLVFPVGIPSKSGDHESFCFFLLP